MAKPLPSRGWFARPDCAAFLGITVQVFDRDFKPLIGDEDRRKIGREVWYRGAAVVEARVAQRTAAKGARQAVASDDESQLFADADSPSLERWRAAKARLAEIQVAREEATLCSVDAVRSLWQSVAARLRRAGEALQRRFGVDAWSILDEGLKDAEQAVETWGRDGAA